jgi:1,4-alpha-glucan branching enzyme
LGGSGYWSVWLNEKNEWIYRQLNLAQERMTALANRFPHGTPLQQRACSKLPGSCCWLKPAIGHLSFRGDESRLCRKTVKEHLHRFRRLHEELFSGNINEEWLREVEAQNNIFPEINYRYWADSAV